MDNKISLFVIAARPRRDLAAVLCALCLLTPAWAGAQQAAAEDAPDAPYVETPAAKYEYHVLAGEMALERGKRALAAREYAAAVPFSRDPALAERATRIAVYAHEQDAAYRAAQAWSDLAPQSIEAQRAATRLALAAADAAEIGRYGKRLVSAARSPDEGYHMLAQLLSGDPAQSTLALDTLGRITGDAPDSAAAQYALGSLALSYDDLPLAAKAAAAAHELKPDWTDAVLLRAGVAIRQGRIEEAEKQVDSLPGSDSTRAGFHAALAQLLVRSGNPKSGRDEFKRAVDIDPDDSDARFGWALMSLGVGDLDVARTQFTHLYDQQERTDDAAFYLGTIANQKNDYADAQHWYQRVKDGDHVFEARLRGAQMIYRGGDLAGARKQLAQLRETYPDRSTQIRAAESDLLLDAGQEQTALDMLSKGLADDPDNSDLLYGRSLVYERMGRIEPAETDLRAMLKQDGNDPRALNALGYMLANHSTDYERARDLISRALKTDPENPAILDSMGWVQYKLGELDEARANLEKAYAQTPQAEIAAHLGEVRWKQGDHEAAQKIWKDAVVDAPDDKVLHETIKRLTS